MATEEALLSVSGLRPKVTPQATPRRDGGVSAKPLYGMQLLEPPVAAPPKRRLKLKSPKKAAAAPEPVSMEGQLLDGFALVNACGAELPEECERAVLTGAFYSDVEVEDLFHFTELRMLDLGDNRIPDLAALARLPAPVDLRLPCNNLHAVTVPPGAFATLKSLDLSYNSLEAEALAALAPLPSLENLDLTCNCIGALAAAEHFPAGAFARLETLALGAQKPPLRVKALGALAALPRLRLLQLPANRIKAAPSTLAAASEQPPFPALQVLDLASNAIEHESHLSPLLPAPHLREIILWGNPLSAVLMGGVTPSTAEEGQMAMPGTDGRVLLSLAKPAPKRLPPIAQLYGEALYGAGPEKPLLPALEFGPEDRIAQAFERLQGKLDAAQRGAMGPVAEEEHHDAEQLVAEEEGDGRRMTAAEVERALLSLKAPTVDADEVMGDEDAEMRQAAEEAEEARDTVFLTGLATTSGAGEGEDEDEQDEEEWGRGGMPLYTGPARRAGGVFGGGDPGASIKALRFALDHPLTRDDDYGAPDPHHRKLTKSLANRRVETRPVLPVGVEAKEALAKAQQVQSIQEILDSMKNRLAQVEKTMLAQAEKADSGAVAPSTQPDMA